MSFRNPFLRNPSTFGYGAKRINKNVYDHVWFQEFKGKDSPSPTSYQKMIMSRKKYDSKTIPRDERICPIVPKIQFEMTNISPQRYQNMNNLTSFKDNSIAKKNSKYFGTRAARNVDV